MLGAAGPTSLRGYMQGKGAHETRETRETRERSLTPTGEEYERVSGMFAEEEGAVMPAEESAGSEGGSNLRASVYYGAPMSDESECATCHAKFTFFKRRHHCRRCAQPVCHGCCSTTPIPLPQQGFLKPVRVCLSCASASVAQKPAPLYAVPPARSDPPACMRARSNRLRDTWCRQVAGASAGFARPGGWDLPQV